MITATTAIATATSDRAASVWDSPANVDLLVAMWREGASAAEIALAIGQGVTRNGVIGKVHRMKLTRRDNAVRAKPSRYRSLRDTRPAVLGKAHTGNPGVPSVQRIMHRKRAEARGLALKIAQARKDGISLKEGMEAVLGHNRPGPPLFDEEGTNVPGRIGFADRRIGKDCAWIPGDPRGGAMCCGRPVRDGSQWCSEHHARVHSGAGA